MCVYVGPPVKPPDDLQGSAAAVYRFIHLTYGHIQCIYLTSTHIQYNPHIYIYIYIHMYYTYTHIYIYTIFGGLAASGK